MSAFSEDVDKFGRETLPRSRNVDACTYFNGSAGASRSQR